MGNPIERPVPSHYYMKADENKNYYLTDGLGGLSPSIEDHNAFHFQVIVPIKTVNPPFVRQDGNLSVTHFIAKLISFCQ